VLDVVIPTRNDAATLPALLAGLPMRAIRSVVVVDRASKDRSVELARDTGALVLREPSGGYGAACLRAQARDMGERVVTGLIDAVYRHRWTSVGPVRVLRFPALIALGMNDRGDGWDVEMLVRAVKLGLSCDEIAVPAEASPRPAKSLGRALLHILRHATMR
jgi:glycosyltransferase involved in cell wall biosynthesis